MQPWYLPLGLLSAGIVLILLETLIPSGGILGLLAGISILASVGTAYMYGSLSTGTMFLALTMAICGILFWTLLRWWPRSALGRKILVEPLATDQLGQQQAQLQQLVGEVGQAVTVMMPGGIVEIQDRQYDATASASIEAGTMIVVTKIRGGNLVVRPWQPNASGFDGDSERNDDGIVDPFAGT